jgi:pyruvate formate lyase activating enzyme
MSRVINELTREGDLQRPERDGAVRCFACGHRCFIPAGRPGICKVRYNEGGRLKVPWGYVGALQCDPVEKKPFFHALPGVEALSFGMLGCDYHCAYCQNWISSQTLRDPLAVATPERIEPDDLVEMAVRRGARIVASTYNEPLITSEWGVAIFRAAARRGLLGAYVSNGNGTEEVLDYIRPWVKLYKVDLKSFRDRNYRELGGTLKNVLDTIANLRRKRFWLEIVTLLVPGFNDSSEEITDIARFIRSVSPDVPWHVTAFHKNYRMTDPDDTPSGTLLRAAEIGRAEGLRYVYAGNIPGAVGDWESTRCPGCDAVLVSRVGYRIRDYRISRHGTCPGCGSAIAGIWHGGAEHPQADPGSPDERLVGRVGTAPPDRGA